jgi:hypothetical protein
MTAGVRPHAQKALIYSGPTKSDSAKTLQAAEPGSVLHRAPTSTEPQNLRLSTTPARAGREAARAAAGRGHVDPEPTPRDPVWAVPGPSHVREGQRGQERSRCKRPGDEGCMPLADAQPRTL